ncbi:hypothetical protein B0H17DRAFT_1038486 [Mycena rosella]|uniref:Uncharacterized protein n=1 Tax=Mycena rosella TaxID=1033263 RepID=A0AAD7M8H5_MYCRO|nr:hypothetical protein B0H17DRAFT_1038486 [Mycena rosella]
MERTVGWSRPSASHSKPFIQTRSEGYGKHGRQTEEGKCTSPSSHRATGNRKITEEGNRKKKEITQRDIIPAELGITVRPRRSPSLLCESPLIAPPSPASTRASTAPTATSGVSTIPTIFGGAVKIAARPARPPAGKYPSAPDTDDVGVRVRAPDTGVSVRALGVRLPLPVLLRRSRPSLVLKLSRDAPWARVALSRARDVNVESPVLLVLMRSAAGEATLRCGFPPTRGGRRHRAGGERRGRGRRSGEPVPSARAVVPVPVPAAARAHHARARAQALALARALREERRPARGRRGGATTRTDARPRGEAPGSSPRGGAPTSRAERT